MPNIVMLEDNAAVGAGIELVIRKDPDNEILCNVPSPQRLLNYISQHHQQIDLAILDIELKVKDGFIDGIEVAEKIRGKYPGIKIMFLTAFDERCHYLLRVFMHFEGYLFKSTHPNELRKAIKEITTPGQATYYPQTTLELYYACAKDKIPQITPSLMEVILLVAQGFTLSEIGKIMSKEDHILTENHIREKCRKLRYLLNARNGPHMVSRAIKFGFISPDDID